MRGLNVNLLLISFGLVVALSACATSPVKAVYEARGSYDVLLSGAADYAQLPRCGSVGAPKICSQQAVVDQMRQADASAKATLDAAEDTVRNHPNVDPSFFVSAAQNAVKAIKAIFTTYGITTPKVTTGSN